MGTYLMCLLLALGQTSGETGGAPRAEVGFDAAGVERCIQDYLEGTSQGRPAQIERAFLATAGLQFVAEGKPKRRTLQQYLSYFKEGVAHDRKGRLVSADITGNACMAKVEIVMRGRRYTDYLLLLKVEDGWRIAEKIFFAPEQAER
ncbi:Nuclear transport factor 2 family protein [Sulfidibacter corallicola]|uniref:Nuclear transport factor 2 family protein n=1 Tax=Sulfidibacter corallicola TaxID=2818388 RepID=A0A8A4TM27_SULCO|nr:nuclear transport factor 2 family protein [Sulfidibacter corallicola]QTD50613.1 nuclear transport factor 2 family protein [Sulfidibacter corallicola]